MELSKQFLEDIVMLSNAASKEEIRYGLWGVWWVDNALYASNGHYGASIPVSYNAPDKVFFNWDDIKKIKFFLSEYKKIEPTFTLEGNTLKCMGDSINLRLDKDAPFIDIARVLQVNTEGRFKVSFNAEYLASLAKAIGVNKNNRNVVLSFDTNNKLAPIVVQSEHTGVLMPCRF